MRIQYKAARQTAAAILALTLGAVAAPLPLIAQDPPPAAGQQDTTVSREEMVVFVNLQLAIEDLQEEAIQEMVRIHSESGRAQIRNNLTEAIASAHEEHGMTPERYKTLTFLVSSDTGVRELYDTVKAEILEESGGGGGEGSG